jgi:segregation and condensation protein B
MSMKAKIEAIIYAAEEPVTLAQLAALLSAEMLSESPETSGESPEISGEPQTGLPTEIVALSGPEKTALPLIAAQEPPPDSAQRTARLRDREIRDHLRRIVDGLIAEYAQGDRGMEIREIAGGYRIATKPEYHDGVRAFVKTLTPPMKLSLQALETLAVIAYKQPVTAPEINEIRAVDSGGVLGSLVSRKLITTAGRKQVVGRPILYKTTREFLLRFGLKDVSELPSMEEFEKMAGELADADESPETEVLLGATQHGPNPETGLAETAAGTDATDFDEVGVVTGALKGEHHAPEEGL